MWAWRRRRKMANYLCTPLMQQYLQAEQTPAAGETLFDLPNRGQVWWLQLPCRVGQLKCCRATRILQ